MSELKSKLTYRNRTHETGESSSAVRLLDLKAAGRYLSLSFWSVRGMLDRGDLPFIRAGRRILVDVHDLDAWIEANKFQED